MPRKSILSISGKCSYSFQIQHINPNKIKPYEDISPQNNKTNKLNKKKSPTPQIKKHSTPSSLDFACLVISPLVCAVVQLFGTISNNYTPNLTEKRGRSICFPAKKSEI